MFFKFGCNGNIIYLWNGIWLNRFFFSPFLSIFSHDVDELMEWFRKAEDQICKTQNHHLATCKSSASNSKSIELWWRSSLRRKIAWGKFWPRGQKGQLFRKSKSSPSMRSFCIVDYMTNDSKLVSIYCSPCPFKKKKYFVFVAISFWLILNFGPR